MAFTDRFRKARGQAPSGSSDMSAVVEALTRMADVQRQKNEELRNLPLDSEWQRATFGPGWPIEPDPLDRVDAQGFVTPRIFQYPVQWNIPGRHDRRHVPWQTLKEAADQPLFRTCIEIRKNRIATLDWAFRVSPAAAAKQARSSGRNQQDVENDLRNKYQDEIERLTDFWTVPDRKNGLEFADWMGEVQEEQLVWDALAVYPQKTYGGNLLNLTVIDGSTVKPLLDEQGGRPLPPFPAYQQILYGFPRGEYTADTADIDGKLIVPGAFSSSQLIYRRRVIRTWTPYGFSPTEQALLDGMLWNKRFQWMMAEYTEGAQPVQYLVNRGEAGWDARQLLEYEKYLNDRLSGKTGERMRNPLLPEGIEPVKNEQTPERYKSDYDLFLIKLQAMHFGVTMPELGFSEPGGLGSTGYHEGEEDIQFRKDLTTVRWLNNFVSSTSRSHLAMPPELEFTFLGLEEEDEAAAETVAQGQLSTGRITLNEDRVRLGLQPYDFPEADMPIWGTQRGVVFLQGAAEAAPPGVLVEPAELKPSTPGDTSGDDDKTSQVQGSPKPARPVVQSGSAADAAKELERFGKWLANPANEGKRFEFRHFDAEGLQEVLKAGSGGGSGPKASSSDSGPDGPLTLSWSPYSSLSS
jgi:hypothetical protein